MSYLKNQVEKVVVTVCSSACDYLREEARERKGNGEEVPDWVDVIHDMLVWVAEDCGHQEVDD